MKWTWRTFYGLTTKFVYVTLVKKTEVLSSVLFSCVSRDTQASGRYRQEKLEKKSARFCRFPVNGEAEEFCVTDFLLFPLFDGGSVEATTSGRW